MISVRRVCLGLIAGSALATAGIASAQAAPPSPAHGRILFLRCASCHDVSDRDSLKTGPNLQGIVGRRVAALPGYAYSPALKKQTFVWSPIMLDRWLTKPDAVVPGTMMAFEGLPSADDRKALIAYLAKPKP